MTHPDYSTTSMLNFFSIPVIFLLLMSSLTACAPSEKSITEGQATVEYDLLYTLPEETISYDDEVRPILETAVWFATAAMTRPVS